MIHNAHHDLTPACPWTRLSLGYNHVEALLYPELPCAVTATVLSPFNGFFLSPFFQDAVLALPVRGILLFLTPQLSPLLHVAIEVAPT